MLTFLKFNLNTFVNQSNDQSVPYFTARSTKTPEWKGTRTDHAVDLAFLILCLRDGQCEAHTILLALHVLPLHPNHI